MAHTCQIQYRQSLTLMAFVCFVCAVNGELTNTHHWTACPFLEALGDREVDKDGERLSVAGLMQTNLFNFTWDDRCLECKAPWRTLVHPFGKESQECGVYRGITTGLVLGAYFTRKELLEDLGVPCGSRKEFLKHCLKPWEGAGDTMLVLDYLHVKLAKQCRIM